MEHSSTHSQTQGGVQRMAQLLPYGKYSGQTQRPRWLGAQPAALLHLARLEETGAQKEKPLALRGRPSACLQLEQNKDGRMGGSSKPDTGDYCYIGKTTTTWI